MFSTAGWEATDDRVVWSIESSDPSVVIDRNTQRMLGCNDAALDFYGLSRDALLSMDYGDLLDASVARDDHSASATTIGSRAIEIHARSDGSSLHVLRVERSMIFDGRPATLLTLIDVSAHVAAEVMKDQERDFLSRVIHALPTAISVKDLADGGRYVLCTRSTEETANLPRDTILGKTDGELFSQQVANGFALSDREVVRTGSVVTTENTLYRPDGSVVVSETRKVGLVDDFGVSRYVIGLTEDITSRRELELRLARVALHDPLTGLANRTLFRERLRAALQRREQSGGFVVLHLLDLDHFKDVNDTLGHAAGDVLLRAVASRIEATCGLHAAVARLGGDEFAVIQGPIASLDEATVLAETIRASIGQPVDVEGRSLVVRASVGLAIAPDHGNDPEMILRNADIALYASKAQGRGVYRFFDASLAAQVQLRHNLDEDLRSALLNEEFELYYQPIIDIAQNSVVSFEALLRWKHPTRGLVPPSEFVSAAEETGMIVQLGDWVIRQACRQAALWLDPIGISVNLSPVQFRHPGLAASVSSALAVSGLSPDRLELEITESVLLDNNAANLDTLHQLRSLGIRISLDDFGTGYSSLGYLSAFPFTKIKIDRSFVKDIGPGRTCLAIVRSVIKLAYDLGMTATAEGVETAEQLDQLRAEGCTQAQGFLFDRPRPADNVPAMLLRLGQDAPAFA